MTEKQSKDSTEILEELSKPYGCYGIKSVEGLNMWIDKWIRLKGDERALDNQFLIVNTQTRHTTIWIPEVFNNE